MYAYAARSQEADTGNWTLEISTSSGSYDTAIRDARLSSVGSFHQMKSEDSAIDHIKRAIKYLERVAGEAEARKRRRPRRIQPGPHEAPTRPQPCPYQASTRPQPSPNQLPTRPQPNLNQAPAMRQPCHNQAPTKPQLGTSQAPTRQQPSPSQAPARPQPCPSQVPAKPKPRTS